MVKMVNDELYSMHIPHDSATAWKLILSVYGIVTKLARKYTEFDMEHPDRDKLTSTLEYLQEINTMLRHLKYCSMHNPRDNITALSLNMMTRLFRRCCDTMEKYLKYIEDTHQNVQGE